MSGMLLNPYIVAPAVPTGPLSVDFVVVAGGGGGGARRGGGGGAGGYVEYSVVDFTRGVTYSFTIGAGGGGGNPSGNTRGTTGSASSIATDIGTITANGGGGAGSSTSATAGWQSKLSTDIFSKLCLKPIQVVRVMIVPAPQCCITYIRQFSV